MKLKKRVSREGKGAGRKAGGRAVRARTETAERKIASLKASEAGIGRDYLASLSKLGRHEKKRITLFLDADVLAWFRGMGRGYQREINRTLRRIIEEEANGREG